MLIYALLLVVPIVVYGQDSIKGTVVDKTTGEPIIGASVAIVGTTTGTLTDISGNFTLNVTTGKLSITFVGYNSVTETIDGKSFFLIELQENTHMLDEMVVVGYGSQAKKHITGAISNVTGDDLSRSTSTTLAGALAGKVQGITTRAMDSRPGRGINLEIRNMGEPLFVIDGIAYGGESSNDWVQSRNISGKDMFNALNPEDIENITILKDASAAVYGLKASSGVVLVTTKKGKNNEKVTVNLNAYYGWQNFTRFPKMANAAQYTLGRVEAAQNEGKDPSSVYTREELAKWQAGTEAGYQGYDYFDIITRKNVPQSHINASISGGGVGSSYYLSVSHTEQDALMKDFSYKRTNIQANLETKVANRLTIGAQLSGRDEITEDVGLPGGDGYFSAILGMFTNLPITGPYANNNPEYPQYSNNYAYNPALFSRDIAGYKDNHDRSANINMYMQYDFAFGLKAKGTVSYNYANYKFDGFQYRYSTYDYDTASDTYIRKGGSDAGWRYQLEKESVSRFAQINLTYDKQIGDHTFSAVAAYERSDYEKNYQAIGTNPSNDYLPLLEMNNINSFSDDWMFQARAGYVGKINYNFRNKYMLEVLGRYDGSYLYARGKRWGFFPGASIGWRASEESFFKGLKNTVDDLKIRASIGQTGKESGVGMFGYLDGYNYNSGGAVLDGEYVIGIQPRGKAVTNLSWEKHTTMNVGFDLTMLRDRLVITADVFQKKITGIPAQRYDVLLPEEIGYGLPNENLNKDSYQGFEGIATYRDKIGDIEFSVSGNFTLSRYKMDERYKERYANSWQQYRQGNNDRWGGIWWGYQVVGRFQSQEEIDSYPIDMDGKNNTTLLPGDFIYKDVNNDGVINSMDERPIGYPQGWAPMIGMGGSIGINWKDFDLNLDFSGGAMQSWFQDYELRNAFHNGYNSPAYLLTDRWHRADPYDPDSEWISGYYPAIREGNSGPNSRNSDFWLHNVRYIRLRNAELGYTLPKSLTKVVNINKCRVYVNASNLFSIDNVGRFQIDPEITANAAVVYPQQRTIILGINVTF